MRTSLLCAFFSLLFLTSCAMYQQEFDCSPPLGVPCTSVTDLESLVIETSRGPDLFIPIIENTESTSTCSSRNSKKVPTTLNRKVWICHQLTEDGYRVQGHYIYQTQTPSDPLVNPSLDPCALEVMKD